MEQSRPTKLPFIALLMYFYVHVNTRANNGRCEWIYFSLVGKNMPPHDRNHWHNSQLPLFSTSLAANSNMPRCRRRDILHKCERRRESDVWEGGSDASLLSSLVGTGRFDRESALSRCPVLCAAALVTALSREEKMCLVETAEREPRTKLRRERRGTAAAFSFCVSWKWSAFRFHSEVSYFFRGSLLADIIAWRHLARWIFAKF